MSAPLGNNNASKAKVWSAAIERALDKRSRGDRKKALDELAEQLLLKCEAGDMIALRELGDRLEGKANQSVDTRITHVETPGRNVDDQELSGIVASGSSSGTTGETDSQIKH